MAEEFTLVFVAMGQGDCCMVRCPDGKVVIVDGGSTANKLGDVAWTTEAQVLLRDNLWAGGQSNTVAALILTHSDADHHNKLVTMFREWVFIGKVWMPSTGQMQTVGKLAKISVDKIYISDAKADNSPLGNYAGGWFNINIYSGYFNTSEIREITINSANDQNNFEKVWQSGNKFAAAQTPVTPVANKRVNVLNGVTNLGKAWSVDIIAGNVRRGYGGVVDFATPDNALSLITLLTIDGKKALLCGDATFSTEKFLLDVQGDLIKNVELVQIPHHGSEYASGQAFINQVNPKAAVISSGFLEHSYRLPRYEAVVSPWLEKVEAYNKPIGAHDIDYWFNTIKGLGITTVELQTQLDTWTNNGTDYSGVDWNESQTFYVLKAPVSGANIAFYSLRVGGMFLFRENLDWNLRMTSQATQFYKLTANGIS